MVVVGSRMSVSRRRSPVENGEGVDIASADRARTVEGDVDVVGVDLGFFVSDAATRLRSNAYTVRKLVGWV